VRRLAGGEQQVVFATQVPIPAALVGDSKARLRDHTQLGQTGLLFWRVKDGGPVKSSSWLRAFKKACQKLAD
jgi:hypothetical protein